MPQIAWENRARRKRAALAAAIPSEWRLAEIGSLSPDKYPNVTNIPKNYLSKDEVTITETPPLMTLASIHAGIWSAEDVVRAFCHRAAIAHQLVNCLSEILFVEAISTARQLDQYQRDTGCLKGTLHGLPVSFMDRFRVAGAETSAGFISWLGPKETINSESLVVKHMRRLGAIPFCKTIIPQSMMLAETANNIYGSTVNPLNRALSSGGAAGGEGALIAMKGSPCGWATEIAGSARIPAAFNDIYSLKSSIGRLSAAGIASTSTSLPIYNTSIAIMSGDLGLLKHIARNTLGSAEYQEDPLWLDIPWHESKLINLEQRRPILAVQLCDGHVQPQPPIQRALLSVLQVLRAQNYEVIEWSPPPHAEAVRNMFKIIGADGAQEVRDHISSSGEPPVQQLRKWYFEDRNSNPLQITEFWNLCKSMQDYRAMYHAYWKATATLTSSGRPVDGVILPVSANAACLENTITYFGYSAIVNLLDFTAVSFPATHVYQKKDLNTENFIPLSDEDASVNKCYDAIAFNGAPVGLQIMCRRAEEELALQLAEIISQIISNPAR